MKAVSVMFYRAFFTLFVLLLTGIHFVSAQITETSLGGSVADSAGNVIAASAVVAQNAATARLAADSTTDQMHRQI